MDPHDPTSFLTFRGKLGKKKVKKKNTLGDPLFINNM